MAKFGYTAGCMKCRSIHERFHETSGLSRVCRERMSDLMRSEGDIADVEKADGLNTRYHTRWNNQAGSDLVHCVMDAMPKECEKIVKGVSSWKSSTSEGARWR